MTEIARYRKIELSAGNVTLCIEKADHWDETEISIGCQGSGKAHLNPNDISCLKMLIAEYEEKYAEVKE